MVQDKSEPADHDRPRDPGFGMVGRRHRVGDHEEGKQQQGAIGYHVAEMIDGPAEPEYRARKFESVIRNNKGQADVNAAAFQQHHESGGADKKQRGKAAAPLSGRDPGIAGEHHGGDDTKIDGVEDVLAFVLNDEFAADREDSRNDRGCEQIRFE